MSLLTDAQRINAGATINSWHSSAIDSINSAKGMYNSIKSQLELMRTNPDYTEEDVVAVEGILAEIESKFTLAE